MSKYKTIQTEYRHLGSLLKSFLDLGIPVEVPRNLTDKKETLTLYGFEGDERPERANIVIRKKHVNKLMSGGSSNDIGFAWNGKTFEAIVSNYDRNRKGVTKKLNLLRQRYARNEIRRQARIKGYSVKETNQPDGTIRLALVHR